MQQLIKPLHGLRGIAALTVVAGHSAVPGVAALGVVLFFVLSGFLIGKLYLEKPFAGKTVWLYLAARFARVYPLFAFIVLGAAALNVAFPGAEIFYLAPHHVPENLLLIGSNPTIWTISVEFQFYVLFVALWWLHARFGVGRALLLAGFVVSFAWAAWTIEDAGRVSILGYLHVFCIGLLLSTITSERLNGLRTVAGWALPLAGVLYVAVFFIDEFLGINRGIYIEPFALLACGGLLLFALAGHDCFANRMLSLPVAVWAGEVSFGIYLFHRPVPWMVDEAFPELPTVIAAPLKLAITLLFAQIAYWIIEKPCRKALRALSERVVSGRSTIAVEAP